MKWRTRRRHRAKVICGWCGKVMGEKEGVREPTHGVCRDCFAELTGKTLEEVRANRENERGGEPV